LIERDSTIEEPRSLSSGESSKNMFIIPRNTKSALTKTVIAVQKPSNTIAFKQNIHTKTLLKTMLFFKASTGFILLAACILSETHAVSHDISNEDEYH